MEDKIGKGRRGARRSGRSSGGRSDRSSGGRSDRSSGGRPNRHSHHRKPGTLYVVATPIGNMEDISARAVRILSEVDLVAAEDTRSVGVFLQRLGVKSRQLSFFEGNEAARTAEIVDRLEQGQNVAVVSESGTPTVSDPGQRLVARALDAGIAVVSVPGPCAAVAALSISGLATGGFLFEGFLPKQTGRRTRRLDQLAGLDIPLVFYESARRLSGTLTDMANALGGHRRASICRELTKVHEEVVCGTLDELALRYGDRPPKGEVTVVVEGTHDRPRPVSAKDLDRQIVERLERGQPVGRIARQLSQSTGWPRNRIYNRGVQLAGKKTPKKQGVAADPGSDHSDVPYDEPAPEPNGPKTPWK